MKNDDIPIGFTMALAQNPRAMEKFATLSDSEKREIIAGTHAINSKEEMQHYVKQLSADTPNI